MRRCVPRVHLVAFRLSSPFSAIVFGRGPNAVIAAKRHSELKPSLAYEHADEPRNGQREGPSSGLVLQRLLERRRICGSEPKHEQSMHRRKAKRASAHERDRDGHEDSPCGLDACACCAKSQPAIRQPSALIESRRSLSRPAAVRHLRLRLDASALLRYAVSHHGHDRLASGRPHHKCAPGLFQRSPAFGIVLWPVCCSIGLACGILGQSQPRLPAGSQDLGHGQTKK